MKGGPAEAIRHTATTPETLHFIEEVLPLELALIRDRRAGVAGNKPPGTGAPQMPAAGSVADAQATSPLGLAFSGGGIRSATFNLGILQGLSELNLLQHVDYLSTVSGGGYIGSWLHGVIRHHDKAKGQPAAARDILLAGVDQEPGPPEEDPIAFLRKYSNYLAPRPGLFSADTWVIGFIWLRNVLLNQLILLPAIAALVALIWLLIFLQQAGIGVAIGANELGINPLAALVALASIAGGAALMAKNLRPIAKQSVQSEPIDKSEGETRAERLGLAIVALIFVAALVLGAAYVDAGRLRVAVGTAVIFVLVMLFLQLAGGFIGCYAAQRGGGAWSSAGVLHVAWMAAVSGLTAAALVVGVWSMAGTWDAWNRLGFAPVLVSLSFIASVMLLVGLMGADYPDAAREWTARIGSMLGIATAAWAAAFLLLVHGPNFVSWLLTELRPLGLSAVAAWLLTTAGGVFAGSSSRTEGSPGTGTKRALELLASVAPTVFLIGYLIAVATGVHVALHRLAPPAEAVPQPAAGPPAPGRYDVNIKTPEGGAVEITVNPTEDGRLAAWLAPVATFHARYYELFRLDGENVVRRPGWLLGLLLGFVAVTLIASSRVNINEFSLHHFYKNRLVRCYLGASKSRTRRPNRLTGFDPLDDFPIAQLAASGLHTGGRPPTPPYYGPYPIVNAALNLNTGSELAQQERKAASFVFTPLVCGFDPPTSRADANNTEADDSDFSSKGYRRTHGFAYAGGPQIGTAVAISGAAANPNWGYHTSGPMAFLLTVFNVRLGWWLGNPRWGKASRRPGPVFALRHLFAELLGQTTGRSKFVNLSDGGHFDNLGLYELVRRRCRFIIVCDAEEDRGLTFGSLGGAIRKCRADFGVEIDINTEPIHRDDQGFSTAHCVVGTISYPEDETAFTAGLTQGIAPPGDSPGKARGWLLYLKSSLTGDEPADVLEYRSRCNEFPHQSTGDQFFSESQFESYRRLGYHVLRSAFEGVKVTPTTVTDLERSYPMTKVFQHLTRKWYSPIPVTAEAAGRLANEYVAVMRRLATEEPLKELYAQLVTKPKSESGVGHGAPTTDTPPSAELIAFGMELMQLMQNVYTEFQFEYPFNRENPRNGGWISVFSKWLKSELLYNRIWPEIRDDYHSLFGEFVREMHERRGPGFPTRP